MLTCAFNHSRLCVRSAINVSLPKKFSKLIMDESTLLISLKELAPPLALNKHKGQAGRICVFGGSFEYTGAPYFSAISALKTGADLVHVFCTKDAGSVIKSYSPELIVHPLLDDPQAISKIDPWLDRFHVVVIGPGMGREESTLDVIGKIIEMCRSKLKPLVIDADGLFLIAKKPELIKDYPSPGVILTPNVMEFARLNGTEPLEKGAVANPRNILEFGKTITVLKKGMDDEIMDQTKTVKVSGGGSGRRCGGQGDLLSGALSTFFSWALQKNPDRNAAHDDRAMAAAFAACKLTRECNARAFRKKGRGMTCSDMIQEINGVFRDEFEVS